MRTTPASQLATPPLIFETGALEDNGGVVRTVALTVDAANLAADGGDNAAATAACLSTDARGTGVGRVVGVDGADNGGMVDVGAYEAQFTTIETPSLLVSTADDIVDVGDELTSPREAVTHAESLGGGTITFDQSLTGTTIAIGAMANWS